MKCATCGLDKTTTRAKDSEFSYRKDRKRYNYDCKLCRSAKGNKTLIREMNEKNAIGFNSYGFLAGAIIERAIKDRAQGFFKTTHYQWLRDTASIEEDVVQRARKHRG